MPRHTLWLIAFCVPFLVLYMATETSTTQGVQHSLSLNGTSSYVSVPNSASLSISGPITVESWIKVNAITGNYQDIVCKESWGQAGSGGGYEFAITSTGKVRLDLYQSHNQYTTVIGSTTVTAGTWQHVAGVFDGNQIRVYLNGNLDGSLSTTNGPASGTSVLNIGKSTYTGYYFGGLIDEVRISAAALYTANFTPGLGPANNTRGYWKFDGQTGNDSSGQGNHSTLQSGATYSTNVPATSNNAPTISITDPLHNTSFASGSTIVIDATASDSDGVVDRVDFYQGATLLGSDTSSPYTFAWNNVQEGVYSITAKATDDDGAITTSSAVAVTVTGSSSLHSLSLNGTSSHVSVPNSTSLSISGPITIEAWVRVNAITGNYQDIVCKESWGQAGSGGGYEFAITSTGKVRLDLYQSHNQYTTVIGSTTVTAGAWQHVAGVFDGNQIRVYLNGNLDGSLSTTNGPASGTSVLNIGKSTYTGYYFGGLIDEVRISAAALYTANFTPGLGPANNTRGYWKFDGQTGNDSSANSNHGTLQSGATYSTNVPSQSGPQRPVPVAGGPYNGQPGQSIQFSNSGSFDPDGTIASYHWNFGDGTSSNSANPSHTYPTAGLYTATLTVTDNAGLIASATAPVTISSGGNARLDPLNQTGGGSENPLSQNFNWNLPLVNLPGRAGLDLSLNLSYNSLVWTRVTSNAISFDDDKGFPSPGFRLGFPVIQPLYFNAEVGKYAFLLIGSNGSRTELRQVGTSALYEAGDSSHLLLDASTMTLRTTDGTQLSYALKGNEYQCTQIKDSNGNYITIDYTSFGRIDKVIDTLGRQIKFNYDASGLLLSITQIWNHELPNQVTHAWATFTYADTSIQTNFSGLTVFGPSNGSTIKTLASITFADGSHTDFTYTSWGQVWKLSGFAGATLLNTRSYNLPGSTLLATGPHTDCPRFTQRRDWARYWNGDEEGNPVPSEEAVTTFAAPVSDTWTMPDGTQQSGTRAQVTSPDGTLHKIYFLGAAGTSSGWRRGLQALVDTYDGGSLPVRRVMTTWTQDNTSVSYPLNPRVSEKNVYDSANNRARTEITYQQVTFANGTSCHLPRDVYEYAANATTRLRSTRTLYNTSTVYTDRRILGLVSEKQAYEGDVNSGGVLLSKVAFFYDNENGASSIQGTDAPIQHDNVNYSASFVSGRANLSSVKRFNVENTAQSTTTRTKYNTAGAVVSARDALDHEVAISYSDSFSDGKNLRNTLAYPTTITDPDSFSVTAKYNFDFGVLTSRRTPQPNQTTNTPGPEQFFTFDNIGRLQQISNSVNSAYTRFEYFNSQSRIDVYTTITEGLGEAHSFEIADGLGRVVATANDHPGSLGGFSGQKVVYDVLGRVSKTYNPTETSATGHPSQWNAIGDDQTVGWLYTQQTYDWRSRPLRTTHPDTKYRELAYSGCGCAGGEVVTFTDEGTIDAGVPKRRQQKIYSDVLGRVVKTEVLNWEAGTPFSTTIHTYNARDQITQIRHYAGSETSSTYQDTTRTYDGYGRLLTEHRPEQNPGTATTYSYNPDDTVVSITDARGAAATYAHNGRHLPTGITYSASGDIPVPAPVTYGYDAAGNRSWMNENTQRRVTYHYTSLSLMDWEERQFPGLAGAYKLSYEYNLGGQLKSIIDPTNSAIDYGHDRSGRVTTVSGTPYGTGGINGVPYVEISQYASNLKYRAWGSLRSLTYGNQMTLSHEFDQSLRLSHLSVEGMTPPSSAPPAWESRLMSSDFQYYADGNLRAALDGLGNVMDRAYSYDHVNGAKEAYSGSEALDFLNGTSSGPASGTYRQSYQFDAFGNMTGRTNRYWSQTDTFTATYSNNRRQGAGIVYDAEGNLTHDTDLEHTYDAAGRSASIFNDATNKIISPVYDGDGQVVHRNENQGGSPITNFFQLRSTVLGGKVITELDAQGQKKKGYVYCNGKLIAQQNHLWVVWQHDNPFTGTRAVSNRDGVGTIDVDPDPMGVDLGGVDPYVEPELWEPPPEGMVGLLPGTGIPSGRCMLDGMSIDCHEAGHLLDIGAAEFEQPITEWRNGNWHFRRFNSGTGRYEVPGDSERLSPAERELLPYLNEDSLFRRFPLKYPTIVPQKPTIPTVRGTKDKDAINDFNNAFNEVLSRLDDPDCAKLFGGKDAALKALYGANYAYAFLGNRTYDPDTQTVQVVGAATNNGTTPPTVYINTYGPFRNTTLPVITPSGVKSITMDFDTGLEGAQFGALLLLHELGHLTGIFKPDANDPVLNRSYTQQVQDACFK